MQELRDFELEIIEAFREAGRRTPRLGLWIRGHLLDVGMDYAYGMYKRYNEFAREAQKMGAFINEISYKSLRTYLFFLKQLNLIRVASEEEVINHFGYYPESKKGMRRTYLTLVEENVDSDAWLNPIKAYLSQKE